MAAEDRRGGHRIRGRPDDGNRQDGATAPGVRPVSARLITLGLAFAPYASLAALDGWWHEKGRVVPKVEQGLHAALALLLIAFVTLVARAQATAALATFAVFVAVLLADEFGFHAAIARRERVLHWCADACLAGFVLFWLVYDGVVAT
jgi:hypothetical protein